MFVLVCTFDSQNTKVREKEVKTGAESLMMMMMIFQTTTTTMGKLE
jgi:hypothetical protein